MAIFLFNICISKTQLNLWLSSLLSSLIYPKHWWYLVTEASAAVQPPSCLGSMLDALGLGRELPNYFPQFSTVVSTAHLLNNTSRPTETSSMLIVPFTLQFRSMESSLSFYVFNESHSPYVVEWNWWKHKEIQLANNNTQTNGNICISVLEGSNAYFEERKACLRTSHCRGHVALKRDRASVASSNTS